MEKNKPIEIKTEDVTKALDDKGITLKCPMCGKDEKWSFGGRLYQMLEYTGKNNYSTGSRNLIPVVVLTHPCGYIVTFNAITLGVMPNE